MEFHENFEKEGLKQFFRKVSVISVPVLKGEAFGIYLLEAMASGIPVIQPALGAFPEIVNTSGGGETYFPNEPEQLETELKAMFSNPEEMDRISREGRKGIESKFHVKGQVKKMLAVYQKAIDKNKKEKNRP